MLHNLSLVYLWEEKRDSFWASRSIYKSEYLETYKGDLYRWSSKTEGSFPQMLSTIQELNFYLRAYGNNPQFNTILENLTFLLRKILLKQPDPFTLSSDQGKRNGDSIR